MFTGLIQQVGALVSLQKDSRGGCLTVRAQPWDRPIEQGESVAVQGVCLTVTRHAGNELTFDVLLETLARTALGQKRVGASLNLERALRVGDAMGGHVVSGHVDGTGVLEGLTRSGRDWVVTIGCDASLTACMIPKGSVALDGVSLTLVDVAPGHFSVHVIPHTWSATSLAALRKGDAVNIENDVMGKYAHQAKAHQNTSQPSITWERLHETGFLS